jgi:hypothetical protein
MKLKFESESHSLNNIVGDILLCQKSKCVNQEIFVNISYHSYIVLNTHFSHKNLK